MLDVSALIRTRQEPFHHTALYCAIVGALMFCLAGCTSTSGDGTRFGKSDTIEELHLFGAPVALSFDRRTSPDGFGVRVFASSRSRAKGVAIRRGVLEILMFDGALGDADPRVVKPTRAWSFPAASLPANATTSALGLGYQFALRWEGAQPVQNCVTVMAKFTPPAGSSLYSAPSVIPMAIR